MLAPYVCNGASHCSVNYTGNPSDWGPLENSGDFTHTYNNPGTYTLIVSSQAGGVDQIIINALQNTQPAVQAYECGNGVSINISDTDYDEYVVNYGDGSPLIIVPKSTALPPHSYLPGPKVISVRGRNNGMADNCSPTLIPLNIAASLPTPRIDLLRVNDATSIFLDFDDASIKVPVLYRLEVSNNTTNPGAFQLVRTFNSQGDVTISGLSTTNNYYCFRIGAVDLCNNTTTYSNTICSADFDTTPVNGSNRLVWRTNSAGVASYSFSRNPANATALSATPPQTTIDDTGVVCNVAYCYQLTSLYANGSRSISLSSCATAFTNQQPSAPQNISIQVTGNTSLDLMWTQDPLFAPKEYTVFKSGDQLGKTQQPTFSDNIFLLNAGDCYAVSYVDDCGNQSVASVSACPLILSAVLQDDNTVALSWNAYNGWLNGVDHYTVERYGSDGQLLGSVDAGAAVTYTDTEPEPENQVIIYRIVASAVDGTVVESISNQVTIIKQPNIYHPNTFTPNSDGLNDTFKVMSQYTSTVEFMVFNRWGEMLFYTTDLTVAWDGTYKGSAVPEGTYVFRAFLTDMSGVKYERSGNVVLLRKK